MVKSLSVVGIAAAIHVIGFCGVASAQAFGFEMGTPASALKGIELIDEDGPLKTYRLKSAPLPHSEFESYMILATEKEGICKVVAVGRDHKNDASGYDVRSAFDDLEDGLSQKYNGGKEYDFLHAGSIWDEPQDFAMSLAKKERSLAFAVERENATGLPDSIANILLRANATSSSNTYLTIAYELSNFGNCVAEQAARDKSGL